MNYRGIKMGLKLYRYKRLTTICMMVLSCLLLHGLIGADNASASGNEPEGKTSHGGTIVFSSITSDNWELWSIKPDGTDIKQLTNTPEDEHSPAAFPGGKEILYVDSNRKIMAINYDGSGKKEIPLPQGIYAQPAWSWDGKTVAYVEYTVIPTDASEIWTIKREGNGWGEPERISEHPPMKLYPSFSPDGTKLVYTQFERDKLLGAVEELGIFYFDERKFKQLTDDDADSFEPVWSPTGEHIAYTSNKSGNYDVWVISLKDKKQRQLTVNPSYDGEPTWSPDGSEIAFASTRSGSKEIWVTSLTGDDLRQLTFMRKTCKDPFWIK